MFEKLETPKYKIIQLVITAILLSVCYTIEHFYGLNGSNIIKNWQFLIMYGFVYIIISIDVFKEMIESFSEKNIFNEQLLMIIATLGALVIAFIPGNNNYMFSEAILVMELFQIGELFEIISSQKSEKSINSLIKSRPEKANLLDIKTNEISVIEAKDVKIDSIIMIKPGELIPLDGIIIEGNTNINAVSLTGESTPKFYNQGMQVTSGCINLTNAIKVKVTNEYNDSTISKIINLVKNANESKGKTTKFIDKFCKWYTPAVLIIAIIVGLIGGLVTKDIKWLTISLSCLIISCPCALVISVPLSYFIACGLAARKGILIKGSNYLEQLEKISTLIFDKTGTLTKGNFKVIKIQPVNGINKNDLLLYAISLESHSNHPIAKAICLNNKSKHKALNIEEVPGCGLKGIINKKTILVGNKSLLNKFKINNIEDPKEIGSYVFIAYGQKYLGYIVVADEIKEDSFNALHLIKSLNIKTIMLSGDLTKICQDVSNKLGIDEYYGQLLPEQKLSKIENVLSENRVVAFVGDGINDAPAIAKANIGISMGGLGSSAAIEASDVVLMEDKLSKIYQAIKISKKANRISKFNIVFALIIKACIFVLTCCSNLISPLFPLWTQLIMPLAIFADVGITILAILNSMRCSKIKD